MGCCNNFRKLASSSMRPQALFCASVDTGRGLLHGTSARGVAPPGLNGAMWPAWSGV